MPIQRTAEQERVKQNKYVDKKIAKKALDPSLNIRQEFIDKLKGNGHDAAKYSRMLEVLYHTALGEDREGTKIETITAAVSIKAANAYIARLNEVYGLERRATDKDETPTKLIVVFPGVPDMNNEGTEIRIGLHAASGTNPSPPSDIREGSTLSDDGVWDHERKDDVGDTDSSILVGSSGEPL